MFQSWRIVIFRNYEMWLAWKNSSSWKDRKEKAISFRVCRWTSRFRLLISGMVWYRISSEIHAISLSWKKQNQHLFASAKFQPSIFSAVPFMLLWSRMKEGQRTKYYFTTKPNQTQQSLPCLLYSANQTNYKNRYTQVISLLYTHVQYSIRQLLFIRQNYN